MVEPAKKPKILGLGLDNDDGHTRVTRAENFHLVGGSAETHEGMQEQAIRFNEKLKDRGKPLDQLERAEFMDIAAESGMNVVEIRRKKDA
ncbi:MAG: hypothetical protein ACLFUJ_00425 [Phycisphaerae bacterium]